MNELSAWERRIDRAIREFQTPFYLFSETETKRALIDLESIKSPLPCRHWLSLKTQSLATLLRWWLATDYGVEVVSRYELLAALTEGFKAERILVNGVGKHAWLKNCELRNLAVHIDSVLEATELAACAKKRDWQIGLRIHVRAAYDPDEPRFPSQFGLSGLEVSKAVQVLAGFDVEVQGLHYHLRSNVDSVDDYLDSVRYLHQIACRLNLKPQYIDIGGGLPVAGEWTIGQEKTFKDVPASSLGTVCEEVRTLFPSVKEIWMEHGRYLTANSGALVVKVLDAKERDGSRFLICDGGRANNALVSDWEEHEMIVAPRRQGVGVLTTVCGPTCMAFDRLTRRELPHDIVPGDYIGWMNAGAYHLSWETKLSNGFARIVWIDSKEREYEVRQPQSFQAWWKSHGSSGRKGSSPP